MKNVVKETAQDEYVQKILLELDRWMEESWARAYTAFWKDMIRGGFQYEEGKAYGEYEESGCPEEPGFATGFELPLDAFRWISPAEAVYHEAEFSRIAMQGMGDRHLEAGWMKIGRRLSLAEMAEAEILLALRRVTGDRETGAQKTTVGNVEISARSSETADEEDEEFESKVYIAAGSGHTAWSDGECNASIASGVDGAAMETGPYALSAAVAYHGTAVAAGEGGVSVTCADHGVSASSGWRGVSVTTGEEGGGAVSDGNEGVSVATAPYGISAAAGTSGIAVTTFAHGKSVATGYLGVALAGGYKGESIASGECGVSLITGEHGRATAQDASGIAVAWGCNCVAKGCKGAHLILADWRCVREWGWDEEKDEEIIPIYELAGVVMVVVDGEAIKEDTWYQCRNGEVIETDKEGWPDFD